MYSILVVDDEKIIREGIVLLMPWQRLQIETVLEATNGLQALRLAKEYKPDVILTDISMPDMDGLEFISQLLKVEDDYEPRIIVLTGYDRFEYAQRCCKLGVNDLVLKPVGELELADVIAKQLSAKNKKKPAFHVSVESPFNEQQNSPLTSFVHLSRSPLVEQAKKYIKENLSSDLTVAGIAGVLHVSPNYLSKLFRLSTDEGCNEYIVRKRMEQAKTLLSTTHHKAYEVAEMVGYTDKNYFSLAFRKHTGLSPTEYRHKFLDRLYM